MQSALAFLAVSSLGVMFGWRPLPNGTPQYEYVVQIEPELLATMKEGTTIPISSEVPDDIRPIARIRITVGSDDLPRERLAGNVKAWPKPETREGLVETQFSVPQGSPTAAPRYQDQPILPPDNNSGQILPPTSRPQSGGDAFGQALQRSAEQARNINSQGAILPPTNEIRPAQTPPRYSQPLEPSNQQFGNQSDINRLFGPAPTENRGNLQQVDDRSPPADNRYQSTTAGGNQILPPATRTPSGTADDWRANETSTAGNRYQRLDEPVTTLPARDIRQGDRTTAPAASTPGVFNAPWPRLERFADAPLAQEWNTRTSSDNRGNSQPASTSVNPATWPDRGTNEGASAFDVADRPTATGTLSPSTSLSFPAAQGNNDFPDRMAGSSEHPQSSQPTPEIRREDLLKPADAELVTASGEPVRPTHPAAPVGTGQLPPAQQPLFPPSITGVAQPASPTGAQIQAPGIPSNNKTFPLLLAWVLLSGSGAGNLYLFWSYLDIRFKYRGLIRTAGRKLGRRIREEVDDDDYED